MVKYHMSNTIPIITKNNNIKILKNIFNKLMIKEYSINNDKYHQKKHRCFQTAQEWSIDFNDDDNKISIIEIFNKKILIVIIKE